jgi:hypothetical protein
MFVDPGAASAYRLWRIVPAARPMAKVPAAIATKAIMKTNAVIRVTQGTQSQ